MGSVVSLHFVGCGAAAVMLLLCYCNSSTTLKRLLWKNSSTDAVNQIVFITGCDSGLGYSFALHAYKLGFKVLAGCLQPDGQGSKQLLQLCPERLQVLGLDVTNKTSVLAAVTAVQDMLVENPELEMRALINNAAVMVCGEFEWMTERQIQHQIDVNLTGTMRITKIFCPILRKYKGRIITVTSHCASACLPGFSVYGATKAGLSAWCDGLRVEQAKYGVHVITFIPGSFFRHSSIMARQSEYSKEMEEAMTSLDQQFFGDYFRRYSKCLSALPTAGRPGQIPDDKLYSLLGEALLSKDPHPVYENAPFRYKYYHFLMKICPTTWLRDCIVQRFVNMPKF